MKKFTMMAMALLLVAGFSLVGCSGDTQRVTVVGSGTDLGSLATGDDEPTVDWYDYASDGFYHPDEDQTQNDTWQPFGHDDDSNPGWSNKPLDNGTSNN